MMGDEEVISFAHEGLCFFFFRFCVMLSIDESEPHIEFVLGRKIGLVQEFITVPSFGRN